MLEPATDAGRRGLAALLGEPSRALVALDYDGTLAPIVADPSSAVPLPGAVAALTALADQVGRVAVITGRAADAVLELGGLDRVPGLVVLGQYGVQRWQGGELTSLAPHPGLADARRRLAALPEGVVVEDKGLSLAVHARRAAEPVAALDGVRGAVEAAAAASGLAVHPGRLVLELRPEGHDKGRALRTLLDGRSSVLFAGDDLGDVAAADEVEAFRVRGGAGLVVCSDSHESPEALRSAADIVVPGPEGVLELLVALEAQLR